jgi:Leucine-rich repeat (LRR) protein
VPLPEFPADLLQLPALTTLDVRSTGITIMPVGAATFVAGCVASTGPLRQNRTLLVSGNPVEVLRWGASGVCQFPGCLLVQVAPTLRVLDLWYNILQTPDIGPELALLQQLEVLRLPANSLVTWPAAISSLSQLAYLDLAFNTPPLISDITADDIAPLSQLSCFALPRLDSDGLDLTRIPKTLGMKCQITDIFFDNFCWRSPASRGVCQELIQCSRGLQPYT